MWPCWVDYYCMTGVWEESALFSTLIYCVDFLVSWATLVSTMQDCSLVEFGSFSALLQNGTAQAFGYGTIGGSLDVVRPNSRFTAVEG